jgi:hypothetical protein
MLAPTSLRIGNWVLHDEDRQIKMKAEDIVVCQNAPEIFSGMEITGEIKAMIKMSDGKLKTTERGVYYWSYDVGNIELQTPKVFEYLHELQNAFKDKTGTELEIDLFDMADID